MDKIAWNIYLWFWAELGLLATQLKTTTTTNKQKKPQNVKYSFSNAWKWKVKVKSLSHVQLFKTPWTAAHQAPPSMGFSRQEYWSGVPLPSLNQHIWAFSTQCRQLLRDPPESTASAMSWLATKGSYCGVRLLGENSPSFSHRVTGFWRENTGEAAPRL